MAFNFKLPKIIFTLLFLHQTVLSTLNYSETDGKKYWRPNINSTLLRSPYKVRSIKTKNYILSSTYGLPYDPARKIRQKNITTETIPEPLETQQKGNKSSVPEIATRLNFSKSIKTKNQPIYASFENKSSGETVLFTTLVSTSSTGSGSKKSKSTNRVRLRVPLKILSTINKKNVHISSPILTSTTPTMIQDAINTAKIQQSVSSGNEEEQKIDWEGERGEDSLDKLNTVSGYLPDMFRREKMKLEKEDDGPFRNEEVNTTTAEHEGDNHSIKYSSVNNNKRYGEDGSSIGGVSKQRQTIFHASHSSQRNKDDKTNDNLKGPAVSVSPWSQDRTEELDRSALIRFPNFLPTTEHQNQKSRGARQPIVLLRLRGSNNGTSRVNKKYKNSQKFASLVSSLNAGNHFRPIIFVTRAPPKYEKNEPSLAETEINSVALNDSAIAERSGAVEFDSKIKNDISERSFNMNSAQVGKADHIKLPHHARVNGHENYNDMEGLNSDIVDVNLLEKVHQIIEEHEAKQKAWIDQVMKSSSQKLYSNSDHHNDRRDDQIHYHVPPSDTVPSFSYNLGNQIETSLHPHQGVPKEPNTGVLPYQIHDVFSPNSDPPYWTNSYRNDQSLPTLVSYEHKEFRPNESYKNGAHPTKKVHMTHGSEYSKQSYPSPSYLHRRKYLNDPHLHSIEAPDLVKATDGKRPHVENVFFNNHDRYDMGQKNIKEVKQSRYTPILAMKPETDIKKMNRVQKNPKTKDKVTFSNKKSSKTDFTVATKARMTTTWHKRYDSQFGREHRLNGHSKENFPRHTTKSAYYGEIAPKIKNFEDSGQKNGALVSYEEALFLDQNKNKRRGDDDVVQQGTHEEFNTQSVLTRTFISPGTYSNGNVENPHEHYSHGNHEGAKRWPLASNASRISDEKTNIKVIMAPKISFAMNDDKDSGIYYPDIKSLVTPEDLQYHWEQQQLALSTKSKALQPSKRNEKKSERSFPGKSKSPLRSSFNSPLKVSPDHFISNLIPFFPSPQALPFSTPVKDVTSGRNSTKNRKVSGFLHTHHSDAITSQATQMSYASETALPTPHKFQHGEPQIKVRNEDVMQKIKPSSPVQTPRQAFSYAQVKNYRPVSSDDLKSRVQHTLVTPESSNIIINQY